MLFQTTQAHEELRAKVRAFAEEEIKPIAFMLDQQNEFPDEAIRKLGEMGLMGIPFPAEYGGAGLDALSYAIAVEELARVDGGAGVILSAHVSLGSWPIFAYGTEEQKRKYLVPLAKVNRENPDVVDVYELVINGQEISPGYSELNDPDVQKERLEHQAAGETQRVDYDFIETLEYGMPSAGGIGIGIDRVIMMLTGASSIRDVLLFPQLKRKDS